MAKTLFFVTDMEPMSISFALEQKDNEIGICLLQDAVYYACKGKKGNGTLTESIKRGATIFTAKKDVELRGLKKLLYPEIKVVDYDEIIDLVLEYERIINM